MLRTEIRQAGLPHKGQRLAEGFDVKILDGFELSGQYIVRINDTDIIERGDTRYLVLYMEACWRSFYLRDISMWLQIFCRDGHVESKAREQAEQIAYVLDIEKFDDDEQLRGGIFVITSWDRVGSINFSCRPADEFEKRRLEKMASRAAIVKGSRH